MVTHGSIAGGGAIAALVEYDRPAKCKDKDLPGESAASALTAALLAHAATAMISFLSDLGKVILHQGPPRTHSPPTSKYFLAVSRASSISACSLPRSVTTVAIRISRIPFNQRFCHFSWNPRLTLSAPSSDCPVKTPVIP